RGSLGLNLATTVAVTLVDCTVCKVPTSVKRPVIIDGQPQGVLLIGRSSSAIKGLLIIPRITDADFTGEIAIIVKTDYPPIYIPQGSKIAQLVPLPHLTARVNPTAQKERGASEFGSTGAIALLSLRMNHRPSVTAALTHKGSTIIMSVLLDSRADVTIKY
ncbi:POK9 protein, partial [Chaetorhynchus papuensis]|nr:POK9 protein [Chaetorhynchus papuensis]